MRTLGGYGKMKDEVEGILSTFSPLTDSNIRGIEMASSHSTKSLAYKKICSVSGCGKKHHARQYCRKHYTRWASCGDALAPPSPNPNYHNIPANYWKHVVKGADPNDCWGWTGGTSRGYGNCAVGHRKMKNAHRVSFFLHHGYWSPQFILHSCGNPLCSNPLHLREGTHADNMRDMVLHGRSIRGENHRWSKLTNVQVLEIFTDSRIYKLIAKDYGVHLGTIWQIKAGRSWAWLTMGGKDG